MTTFVRYVAVQIVAYAIDLGVFLLLFNGGLAGAIAANVVAKIAAGAFAFAAHRGYTFGIRGRRRIAHEAAKYGILLALNVPVASAILVALTFVIPNVVIAKIVADVVCVGLTFLATRHGVFGKAAAAGDERPVAER